MHNSPISQLPTPITPAGSILTITVGILLAEDLTKATLREGSPNVLKVTPKFMGWKTTNESAHSHDADHWSGPKDNTAPSSRPGVSATCSSALGCGGGVAGGSSQGPGEPKQEVAHLTVVVSDGHKSIFSSAQASVKHHTSHRVFISHYLAFCPIVNQGWDHYSPMGLSTKH